MSNDAIITRLERIIDLIRRCQEGNCICSLFDNAIHAVKIIESKF